MSEFDVKIKELYDGTYQVIFYKKGKEDYYECCWDMNAVRFLLTEYFDG